MVFNGCNFRGNSNQCLLLFQIYIWSVMQIINSNDVFPMESKHIHIILGIKKYKYINVITWNCELKIILLNKIITFNCVLSDLVLIL